MADSRRILSNGTIMRMPLWWWPCAWWLPVIHQTLESAAIPVSLSPSLRAHLFAGPFKDLARRDKLG